MDWTRGHTIGRGSSATVSMAVSRRSGHIFAVKSAEFSQSEPLQREQKIISTLNSPRVVAYKGYDITRENNKLVFNLMMEYAPGGTLADAICNQGGGHGGSGGVGGGLDEAMIAYYTRQIVQGLEYLHSIGIVHCDIKGRNILLAGNGTKIADFGCSKRVFSGGDDQIAAAAAGAKIGGTPMFMAPEAARGEEQLFAADIWALGCTIIEMATGGPPWPNPNLTNPASVLYQTAFSSEIPKLPGFLSDQAKDFLSKCLTRNSEDRWTAKQLLEHPFLGEFGSGMKHIQDQFDTTSPTSILDQGIWNSVEECQSSFEMARTCLSNSPSRRVKSLSSVSGEPDWRWEETWITIRSNEEDNAVLGGENIMNNYNNTVGSVSCSGSNSDSLMKSNYMEQRVAVNNLHFERHQQIINQKSF